MAVVVPTLKVVDVADVSPADVNVIVCCPDPVTFRFVKVATPLTALTVVVPDNVAPAPLIAAVTCALEVVTRTFDASRI